MTFLHVRSCFDGIAMCSNSSPLPRGMKSLLPLLAAITAAMLFSRLSLGRSCTCNWLHYVF